MKVLKNLENILGILVRDIIAYTSNEYVEYTVRENQLIYRWHMPFNLSLGAYTFLKKEEYNALQK